MNSTFLSLCVLGRQPALGLAELESLYGASAVSLVAQQIAGLTMPAAQVDFKRLGGSTRVAEVIAEVPSKLWKDVEKQLAKSIVEISNGMPEGKLRIGFSTFGIPVTPAKLNASGLTLKKIIRGKTSRSVRLIPNPELELNTAQVLHNQLTGPTGIEMLIIATTDGTTLLARTTAVQDIDSYTLRDRGRPKRDARVGMLPPKLAQTIINLATRDANPNDITLLDPFCGTGVILQEAGLMHMQVYGTDLEDRMVKYSRENVEWIQERLDVSFDWKVAEGDATAIQWEPGFNVVAGETYLGRPFTDRPDAEILAQTLSEVNLILKRFLQNLAPQIAPGTRLCLAVPAWQTRPHEFKHLPLVDQIADLGYNRTRFEHVRDEDLLYYREDQYTARELLVLIKQ
jgi:tRNA (guanine10-N2)-dimethyltransferase